MHMRLDASLADEGHAKGSKKPDRPQVGDDVSRKSGTDASSPANGRGGGGWRGGRGSRGGRGGRGNSASSRGVMNAGGRGGQRGMSTGQERTPHLKGAGLRRWVRGQELSDQIEADLNQAKKRANTKLYNRLINKVAACRFALQDAVLTEGVRQYAKQKSPATAMRVFQQMKKCGIKPTHFTWGCLINAYSMNGDAAKAEKQMHDMLRAGEDANWVPGLSPN